MNKNVCKYICYIFTPNCISGNQEIHFILGHERMTRYSFNRAFIENNLVANQSNTYSLIK